MDIGEPFTYKKVAYTFHQPTIADKKSSVYYEVPVTIKNNSDEPVNRLLESFTFQGEYCGRTNKTNLDSFIQHHDNQNLTNGGVPPHQEVSIVVMTDMVKDWGLEENSKMIFYHVIYDGNKVVKMKVNLN